MSKPSFVPSRSIEFSTISPAPSRSHSAAQATASHPVGALVVVAGGQLDRVTGVPKVQEVDALDDAPAVDVEARDHTDAAHAAIASCTEKRPSYNARPTMAPARRRPPATSPARSRR